MVGNKPQNSKVAREIQLHQRGHLRNRITLIIVAVLLPILGIFTWLDVRWQQRALENLLLEKAETIAITGAQTVGHLLERAIDTGELTKAQVFDKDYVTFWEFDPAEYPDFEGDPNSLTKYHTAYDTYTDEHWQELLDSYLTSEEIVFAIPVDINGYLPTHNTRWSSWDGSPATDRSKRIFDDPVGIKAAQNTEPVLQQVYPRPGTGETLWDISAPIYVKSRHWGAFRVGMELTRNQARVVAAFWRIVGAMLVVVVLTSLAAWGLGWYIAKPIVRLASAAVELARGRLDQQITIPNLGEITVLAEAFNEMSRQVGELIENLEMRVSERTDELKRNVEQLQVASRVAHDVAIVKNLDTLLVQVVDLISERFGFYHAGIFLIEEFGGSRWAVFKAASSEGGAKMLGRGHRLEVGGKSMVGYVTQTGNIRIASDVGVDAVYFDNPDLPDTHSAITVPLRVRDQVIGALDVQSEDAAAFDQSVANVLQTVADQIAVAIDNARLLTEAEERLQEMANLQRRLVGTAWTDYLTAEGAKAYARGLTIEKVLPAEAERALDERRMITDRNVLAVPIMLQEQPIGVVGFRKQSESETASVETMTEQQWTEQEIALIESVTQQVALALDNLRLFEETQSRARREQLTREIADKMRQAGDLEALVQTAMQELAHALSIERVEVHLESLER